MYQLGYPFDGASVDVFRLQDHVIHALRVNSKENGNFYVTIVSSYIVTDNADSIGYGFKFSNIDLSATLNNIALRGVGHDDTESLIGLSHCDPLTVSILDPLTGLPTNDDISGYIVLQLST